MKAIKGIAALVLAAAMLAMPVFAADFVPSIEFKDGVQLVDAEMEGHDDLCCFLLLIPYRSIGSDDIIDEEALDLEYEISEEMEQAVRDSQTKAKEELESTPLRELVTDFPQVWDRITGGAPLENAVVSEIFEVVRICTAIDEFITDEKVTFSFTAEGIGADDLFAIIHKPTGSEKWQAEEYTIDENGVITVTVDALSPFAIITDSGEAPAVTVTSPQTGVEAFSAAAAAAGAVLLGLGGAAAGRKLRKNERTVK